MQEEQNVGTHEQWIRVLGGNLASLTGIVFLIPGLATLLSGILGVILVLLGLYLFVTGSTGYCPIYQRLGLSTQRIKGKHDDAPNDWRQRINHIGGGGWKYWGLMILFCLPMVAVIAWIVLRT